MSRPQGVLRRLFAIVHALLPEDWFGQAGDRFRKTSEAISTFAEEHRIRPGEIAHEGIELTRTALHGKANKDLAAAVKDFAEAEHTKVQTELQKRSLETQVEKEEIETQLARLRVLDAEIELLKKLKDCGLVIHRDKWGNLTVLPCSEECDLDELARRRLAIGGGDSVSDLSGQPFLMPIEDIFFISGRGTVVTGRIDRGKVKVGEVVEIVGFREARKTVVTGVEMFKKQMDEGRAGDNAGLFLRGIGKDEVERGMVLAKPGSITPHTKFKAAVYMLMKEEGGRHTPFFKGYRPQFYFRTTDVTGVAELPAGTELVMPGDTVALTIELITPVAIEKGLRFAVREGGRTVGAGTISEILV